MLHNSERELTRTLRKIPHHLHEVWLIMTTGDKIAITGLAVAVCGSLLAVGVKVGNVETKQDSMAQDVAEIKTTLNEIAPRKVKTATTNSTSPASAETSLDLRSMLTRQPATLTSARPQ